LIFLFHFSLSESRERKRNRKIRKIGKRTFRERGRSKVSAA
jgi:hypothetical protein